MSQQDDIKAFNQYCAEVCPDSFHKSERGDWWYLNKYAMEETLADPYSNLNQLAEVFDKVAFSGKYDCAAYHLVVRSPKRYEGGVAAAMREFIWSTKNG